MNPWQRLRKTFSRRTDSEIDAELQAHLEMREEQLIGQGMKPSDARREARRQFGNRLQIQEDARSADLFPVIDTFLREGRQALRSLSARPGLVAVAVGSLALGIGANAMLFSAMDAVFWKPLPVRDPASLVQIQTFRNNQRENGNPARARDYHERLQSVEGVGGFYGEGAILPTDAGPRRVSAFRTIGPTARLLGVEPARGRRFTAEEERGANVALLTDRFWRTQFSADPGVMGRELRTTNATFTIVGVLPPGLAFPRDADFWAPADRALQSDNRGASFMPMIARLKPGFTPSQVDAELRTINAALAQQYPDTDKNVSARTVEARDDLAGDARTPLLAAWGAVGAVLLIACLNIASLLLARGMERTREAAIRAALGASRLTLIRTFLAESLLLAAAGAGAGLLVAIWGIDLLAGYLPSVNVPALDHRVVAFSLGLALLCALTFGLGPAFQSAGAGLAGSLNELARASGSKRRLWLRGATVVAQSALSLVLLGLAGLFFASFDNQKNAPVGFAPSGLVAARVNLPWDTDMKQLHSFTAQTLERLRALPGVEQAALTDRLPLEGGSQSGEIVLRGRALAPDRAKTVVNQRAVSADYFATMRVPLRAGRVFEARPNILEAVVNETFAKTFFPSENPIGQAFAQSRGKVRNWITITGVIPDLRLTGNAAAPTPEIYRSFDQTYWPMLTFVVRSAASAERLAPEIREAIRTLDPNHIVESIAPVESALDEAFNTPRRMMQVAVAFAAIALALALIGLYGVMASDVNQRKREFGIRLALGASRGDVLGQSLRRGAKLAVLGVLIGIALSLIAQRQAEALLYGVTAGDPRWLAGSALTLLVAALAATFWPAWKGASLDPAITLRHE